MSLGWIEWFCYILIRGKYILGVTSEEGNTKYVTKCVSEKVTLFFASHFIFYIVRY